MRAHSQCLLLWNWNKSRFDHQKRRKQALETKAPQGHWDEVVETNRDEGLRLVIAAAGGVGSLARALGIAQPSVSAWKNVPAERVLTIETATGVPRSKIRPDLYPADDSEAAPLDETDAARVKLYLLLADLLKRAPSAQRLAELSRIRGDATELGLALMGLAQAAERASDTDVSNEYFALLIGVGRGELMPFGSYYQTGFLHERPLARIREDLARSGIERSEGSFESEDHAGVLCEIMAGLIDGSFEADLAAQSAFFTRHLKPFMVRFFADVETSRSGTFYPAAGRLGRVFMEIEAEGFALSGTSRH